MDFLYFWFPPSQSRGVRLGRTRSRHLRRLHHRPPSHLLWIQCYVKKIHTNIDCLYTIFKKLKNLTSILNTRFFDEIFHSIFFVYVDECRKKCGIVVGSFDVLKYLIRTVSFKMLGMDFMIEVLFEKILVKISKNFLM